MDNERINDRPEDFDIDFSTQKKKEAGSENFDIDFSQKKKTSEIESFDDFYVDDNFSGYSESNEESNDHKMGM